MRYDPDWWVCAATVSSSVLDRRSRARAPGPYGHQPVKQVAQMFRVARMLKRNASAYIAVSALTSFIPSVVF
jgi:hypothetical protein